MYRNFFTRLNVSALVGMCLIASGGLADIRNLDLTNTFGWELARVEDDVARAVDKGDFTFFASGGIGCSPIGVPPEYLYLATSTHVIYCGCTNHPRDEEEAALRRQQFDYARAYNKSLLSSLTSHIDSSNPDHVLNELPSRSEIQAEFRRISTLTGREIHPKGFDKGFVDTAEGRATERRLLEEWNVDLGYQYQVLGLYSLPWSGWRYDGVNYPQHTVSYKSKLGGKAITVTAIGSARDMSLPGSHITLLLEGDDVYGWGRLTVTDNRLVSGTLHFDNLVYRILSFPNSDQNQVIFKLFNYEYPQARGSLLRAVYGYDAIKKVEKRHLEIDKLWQERNP